MRNDALDDPKHLPPLRADYDPIGRYPSTGAAPAGHGGLWFCVLLLGAGLTGALWWQQLSIQQLERQLVATQDSFARIAEEAAERQHAWTVRLEHLEERPQVDRQALEERLARLESTVALPPGNGQVAEGVATPALEELLAAQQHRLEALAQQINRQHEQQQAQQAQWEHLSAQLSLLEQAQLQGRALYEEQHQQQLVRLASLSERLNNLAPTEPIDAAAVRRLEQELLVLRSGLERPVPLPKGTVASQEFDLFRAQTTRHITALQGQVANLQQQLDQQRR